MKCLNRDLHRYSANAAVRSMQDVVHTEAKCGISEYACISGLGPEGAG